MSLSPGAFGHRHSIGIECEWNRCILQFAFFCMCVFLRLFVSVADWIQRPSQTEGPWMLFLHKAADNEVIYVTNNIPLNISFARVLIGMDFLFVITKLIILVLAILCIVVAVHCWRRRGRRRRRCYSGFDEIVSCARARCSWCGSDFGSLFSLSDSLLCLYCILIYLFNLTAIVCMRCTLNVSNVFSTCV